MHIRFFNTFEPVTTFYRDLIPALAAQGIESELVISSMEYRPGREPLESSLDHPLIHIRRVKAGQGLATSRAQKVWAMVSYTLGAVIYSLFGRSVDLNFFMTQPPLFSLWGYLLRLLRRQRYVCLVMDLYPDGAIKGGLLPENGSITQFLTATSRFALKNADAVVVIGRCTRDLLHHDGMPEAKLHLIPNWVNNAEIQPISSAENRLLTDWDLTDRFVVLYSGIMGVSHFFDDILESAKRLKDTDDIRFVFIGAGSRRREIEAARVTYGLDNVMFFPYQPLDRLSESLSAADIHYVCLRDGFEGSAVPSKAYGALAVGKPLLYQGSTSGEIARMVLEERIGTVVPLYDAHALTQAILRYYQDPDRRLAEGDRARRLNERVYNREHSIQSYLALFQRIAE
ncbi:MAG TPA: glycosyltransferase family 4 protein [Anaerolineae bacterium]|nr:glycosyltransferase family 4 protein [Anaerolineae bacterium]